MLLAVAQSQRLLGALVLLSHDESHDKSRDEHDKSHDGSHDESHDESHEPNPPHVNYDHTPADQTRDDSQTHKKLFQQEGEAAGEDFVS